MYLLQEEDWLVHVWRAVWVRMQLSVEGDETPLKCDALLQLIDCGRKVISVER